MPKELKWEDLRPGVKVKVIDPSTSTYNHLCVRYKTDIFELEECKCGGVAGNNPYNIPTGEEYGCGWHIKEYGSVIRKKHLSQFILLEEAIAKVTRTKTDRIFLI